MNEAIEAEDQLGAALRQLGELREDGRVRDAQLSWHGERFRTLERQVGQVLKACDELRDRAEREFGRSRRAVQKLAGHTRWLETRIRLDRPLEPVDLEVIDSELTDLVDRVQESRDLHARLLTPAQRAEQRKIIDDFAALEKEALENQREAIARTRTLSAAIVGGSRRQRRHASGYRHSRRLGDTLGERLDAARPYALRAQALLDADERRREEYRTHIGTNAGAVIAGHLRARIDAAVRTGGLFPAWFTITELGHQPPPDRAAHWRETATSLLLYRITYRVSDPTVALGPPPGRSDQHRLDWHHRLVRALRELA